VYAVKVLLLLRRNQQSGAKGCWYFTSAVA
jgi:hypothetical protein